ncbi:MAG: type I 3-dehydroquinate dehydratase [Candidatus Hadarchaeales archaeon]
MNTVKIGKHTVRTPAVCASVAGEVSDVKRSLKIAERTGADIAEMRIDLIRGKLEDLMPGKMPAIITNRPRREGGDFSGSEDERVGMILDSLELSPACIDLEISTPGGILRKAIKKAKQSRTSVLLSYHNFSGTPDISMLRSVLNKMVQEKCDIAKIVTNAESKEDAFRMLEFILEARGPVPSVAFAMGKEGRLTRYTSLVLGSPWTYAGVGRPTAPGQLDLKTAVEWVRVLRRLEVR